MSAEAKKLDNANAAIPLLDLSLQNGPLRSEIMDAIAEVCDSQRFIMGPKVSELEESVAQYSNTRHGVGVSSGTDALLLALMALDIGRDDEVITTPYSFFATAGVVARVGAVPVFCDIDPATYNLSPERVLEFIETNTREENGTLINTISGRAIKAMIIVHLYGQMADMTALMEIANKYGLKVVEDAAQSIGSEDGEGRRAGSIGDVGCFSFFPSKNLGAYGDAGMCVANDDKIAERLRVMRVHGASPKYYHSLVGGNFRLDALQAAVLSVKLKHLDSWTSGRQQNATYYDEAFAKRKVSKLITPKVTPGRHIYNQYILRVPDRDGLRDHLRSKEIGCEVYYPVSLHVQECFASLGYKQEDCNESYLASQETIAIPIFPELNDEQKNRVVDVVADYCA